MEGTPSEEQIKPKRAPPKRKQQPEPEIKETEIKETPKEEIQQPEQNKEDIKIVKMVKCEKRGKSLTAKSLKYSHKCGQDNNKIMKQPAHKIIENETVAVFQPIHEIKRIPKSTFPDYELNPRVQRMQGKSENKTLFAHAI